MSKKPRKTSTLKEEPQEPTFKPLPGGNIRPEIEATQQPTETLETLCKQLPEPKMVPDQRWYGEDFYPQYTRIHAKIKALLNK